VRSTPSVGPRFTAPLRRIPLRLVNRVVVIDAAELTFIDYRGLAGLGIEFFTTTVLRVRPAGIARALSDLRPVPGLQVVHT